MRDERFIDAVGKLIIEEFYGCTFYRKRGCNSIKNMI
jgi:hypothetical protein